jgi:tRNA-Thr(GGU) m(6)t(6)A37 methyltransferase TsaA
MSQPSRPSDNAPAGAEVVFVGRAHTPWRSGNCPKNMREARERGQPATVQIDPPYHAALTRIERASHLILLGWFAAADRRRLTFQPGHLTAPHGVFALRSPGRPNPIGVSIAALVGVDAPRGLLTLDALDWYDGTPVIDIKPYIAGVDSHPDARVLEVDA